MPLTLNNLPEWRKIGWRVGKRLRDILYPPSGSDRPTEEELQAIRLKAVLQGFAYFNTLNEVEEWSTLTVDALQRANVPLCPRSEYPNARDSTLSQGTTTKTILCHDFKGGYVDYEGVRPSSQLHAIYSCEYLQSVDSFIYFSHHLVTVPPPTWTNCLHTNGVKVLGTFILEPQTHDVNRVLVFQNGNFVIARQLAAMAEAFGFDGWLLNFEKKFQENSSRQIADFIEDLKSLLGSNRTVLWYDALSTHNEVDHQNGLTHGNARFAQKADGLFTNYKWGLRELEQSCALAESRAIPRANLFFGIDVWAQNNRMSGPPRITFPEKGGGGTNTGLAMQTLADAAVSTAIFAPGWSHEHFSSKLNGLTSVSDKVSEAMWEGTDLPEELPCDCDGSPHHTASYQIYPILRSSAIHSAGSPQYFFTDFRSAFQVTPGNTSAGSSSITAKLGLQSTFPMKVLMGTSDPPSILSIESTYSEDLNVSARGKRSMAIKFMGPKSNERCDSLVSRERKQFQLYPLAINSGQELHLRLLYSVHTPSHASGLTEFGIYLAFSTGAGSKHIEYVPIDLELCTGRVLDRVIKEQSAMTRISELGLYHAGYGPLEEVELARFHQLNIIPQSAFASVAKAVLSVKNLKLTSKEINGEDTKRLEWDWAGDKPSWPDCLPWSEITGPFRYFIIRRDEVEIGTSQTTAFPLNAEELACNFEDKDGVIFSVEGVCFAGVSVNKSSIASVRISNTAKYGVLKNS